DVYRLQSRYTEAERSYIRAKNIYADWNDAESRASALNGLGDVYRLQSKYTEAERSYTRAKKLYAGIDDDEGHARALTGLGDVYRLQSKCTQAQQSFTRAQEIYPRIGHDEGRANGLRGVGYLRWKRTSGADDKVADMSEDEDSVADDDSSWASTAESIHSTPH
ncbi:hypothetical protein M407DRAFT_35033, partial [Tulasnella calospora MUT 4182]